MSMVPDAHSQMLIRVSDTDRDSVIARLRDGYAEGRLTFEEFSDRVDHALAARRQADLDLVITDLPVRSSVTPVADGQSETQWLLAVISGNHRTGRWRVPPRIVATAIMGSCRLDLREAQFDAPEVLIDAVAILGSVGVMVPEGMEVEFDGFAIMGGKECRLANVPAVPGAPRIRVRVFGLCGAVKVRTKQHWSKRVDAMLDWLDGRFLGR